MTTVPVAVLPAAAACFEAELAELLELAVLFALEELDELEALAVELDELDELAADDAGCCPPAQPARAADSATAATMATRYLNVLFMSVSLSLTETYPTHILPALRRAGTCQSRLSLPVPATIVRRGASLVSSFLFEKRVYEEVSYEVPELRHGSGGGEVL